jgi:hypothetical protein
VVLAVPTHICRIQRQPETVLLRRHPPRRQLPLHRRFSSNFLTTIRSSQTLGTTVHFRISLPFISNISNSLNIFMFRTLR